MINILFIDPNRGGGIELIGKLFLNILKIINPINIDIYDSQCYQQAQNIKFKIDYDLCFFNDFSNETEQHHTSYILLEKVKKNNIPIVNISHNYKGVENNLIDFNFVLNGINKFNKNIFAIDFISGNIWKNLHTKRFDNKYLIPIRLNKLNFDFLHEFKNKNPEIELDVYCLDKDRCANEYKDIINYKGFVPIKQMVSIYNSYEKVLIPSTSECLCMPIREALLCGCDVFVNISDNTYNYTKTISGYINYFDDKCHLYKKSFIDKNEFCTQFNIENMILQFFSYIKSISNFDIWIDLNKENTINYLLPETYKNDCSYDGNVLIFDDIKL